jgi:SAM-dependent methyltransferase
MPKATETRSLSEVKEKLDDARRYARTLSARLEAVQRPNMGRRLLELGAAAGGLTIGFAELGYSSVGVEPFEGALATAQELADWLNIPCPVVPGRAEAIPFPAASFDIVIANSVFEHVIDIELCFREVARVLAPGGLFWFETASSMCPRQGEIRGFPFFGWYPHPVKLRIMKWAVDHCPRLVGHTQLPAIHWFNDRIAERYFRAAGFGKVWDRWDLRKESEGGTKYALALRVIRKNRAAKALANALLTCCAYAAVKEG